MPIHRYKSKIWQQLLIMLLLAAFLCSSLLAVPSTVAAAQKELLNDRSADIIGSTPLLVPGILTPRGLSGRGQIVGLADSGLDKGQIGDLHPDLQSEPGTMPRVAMLRSYVAARWPMTLPDMAPIWPGSLLAAAKHPRENTGG